MRNLHSRKRPEQYKKIALTSMRGLENESSTLAVTLGRTRGQASVFLRPTLIILGSGYK